MYINIINFKLLLKFKTLLNILVINNTHLKKVYTVNIKII